MIEAPSRARTATGLALAALALGGIGCTRIWPFNRSSSASSSAAAPAAETVVSSGQNDAGLKATVSNVKERAKTLSLTLALSNGAGQTVDFRNPVSLRVAGFQVAADGREGIGADGGKLESKRTPAAQLKELKAGAHSELELKYTFDPSLAHESYPWTLTISNLWIADQKLGDITLNYVPAPGAK